MIYSWWHGDAVVIIVVWPAELFLCGACLQPSETSMMHCTPAGQCEAAIAFTAPFHVTNTSPVKMFPLVNVHFHGDHRY